MSYIFLPSKFVAIFLSKALVEHVTGHFRLLFPVAPCWMGLFCLLTFCNMLRNISHWFPTNKRSCQECFGGPFNPLVAQRHMLCKQGFSFSVCQAVEGVTQAFKLWSTINFQKNVQVGVLIRLYYPMPFWVINCLYFVSSS